ncbi:MAG: glycosyltransferase family 2 protein [Alphaproteobacteria bacterium]|nr:glycosyltransferase family 2 protein [Alphaproteobacteria bacterium]
MIDPSAPSSAPPPDSVPELAVPELAVVVPVRNEEDNVIPLIEEIHAALDGVVPFEVIYVDDGSTDATPQRLAEAGARFPRLRTLRHRVSCGQSQAVATGVKAARAPWIATLDGDGQNDPADIPLLLEASRAEGILAPMTLIAGHRRKRRDTWIKRVSSRFANRVRAGLLGDDTPDTGCGLKLFNRGTFLDFPRFDHMHRYLPALVIRAGGRVVSVPVNHRPRERGRSNYGTLDRLWVGLFDLIGVMWLQRRGKNPVVEPDRR